MTAKEIIDEFGAEHGWTERQKVGLLCRFVGNLEFIVEGKVPDGPTMLREWLTGLVSWEKHGLAIAEAER